MEEQLKETIATAKDYFTHKDFKRAESLFKKVLRSNQWLPDVHNYLGLIYHDKGKFDNALESFEKALEINPSYTEASLNLAVTYHDMGHYREAQEIYGRVNKGSEGQHGKMSTFARSKMANRHAEIGDIYRSMACFKEAIHEYQKALKLAPNFPDIKMKLAIAFREKGEKTKAVQTLRQILKKFPAFAQARLNLGITLFTTGKKKQAVEEWKKVLETEPENKIALMYLRLSATNTNGNKSKAKRSTKSKKTKRKRR